MKTVYKYEMVTTDRQVVTMPMGAEILCVQVKRDIPCLWAMVDTEKPPADRHIRIAGTGQPLEITSELDYIGTYQLYDGALVCHVFDCGEKDR